MKKLFLLLVIFNFSTELFAQQTDQQKIDLLIKKLATEKEDTNKVNTLIKIIEAHIYYKTTEGFSYGKLALDLAEKLNWQKGIAYVKLNVGRLCWNTGKFDDAKKYHTDALNIFEKTDNKKMIAFATTYIGQDYGDGGNLAEAEKLFNQSMKIYEGIHDTDAVFNMYNLLGWVYSNEGNTVASMEMTLKELKYYDGKHKYKKMGSAYGNLADDYERLGKFQDALNYRLKELSEREQEGNKTSIYATQNEVGNNYAILGNYSEALRFHQKAINIGFEIDDKYCLALSYRGIANIHKMMGKTDEALKNYLISLSYYKAANNKSGLICVYNEIANCYLRKANFIEAKKYFDLEFPLVKELNSKLDFAEYCKGVSLLDSATENWNGAYFNFKKYIFNHDQIYNQNSAQKVMQLSMEYDFNKKQVADSLNFVQQKEIGNAELSKQTTLSYAGLSGIGIMIILLFFVYRNYIKQRKTTKELKQAQRKLIQNEKMAAIGVVATRVAHEILNPLNFVNNFSKLSEDLLDEINESENAVEKRESTELLISNLEKINEHSMRASEIVKQLQELTVKGMAHEFFAE